MSWHGICSLAVREDPAEGLRTTTLRKPLWWLCLLQYRRQKQILRPLQAHEGCPNICTTPSASTPEPRLGLKPIIHFTWLHLFGTEVVHLKRIRYTLGKPEILIFPSSLPEITSKKMLVATENTKIVSIWNSLITYPELMLGLMGLS